MKSFYVLAAIVVALVISSCDDEPIPANVVNVVNTGQDSTNSSGTDDSDETDEPESELETLASRLSEDDPNCTSFLKLPNEIKLTSLGQNQSCYDAATKLWRLDHVFIIEEAQIVSIESSYDLDLNLTLEKAEDEEFKVELEGVQWAGELAPGVYVLQGDFEFNSDAPSFPYLKMKLLDELPTPEEDLYALLAQTVASDEHCSYAVELPVSMHMMPTDISSLFCGSSRENSSPYAPSENWEVTKFVFLLEERATIEITGDYAEGGFELNLYKANSPGFSVPIEKETYRVFSWEGELDRGVYILEGSYELLRVQMQYPLINIR